MFKIFLLSFAALSCSFSVYEEPNTEWSSEIARDDRLNCLNESRKYLLLDTQVRAFDICLKQLGYIPK